MKSSSVSKSKMRTQKSDAHSQQRTENPKRTKIRNSGKVSAALVMNTEDNLPKYQLSDNIPRKYNENFIDCIAQDPNWLFVYWEIKDEDIEKVMEQVRTNYEGTSKRVLRLFPVDTDENISEGFSDLAISPNADNWYVKVPLAGKRYIVQCGELREDGTFFPMVESATISMPTREPQSFDSPDDTDPLIGKNVFHEEFWSLRRKGEWGGGPVGESGELLSSESLFSFGGNRS